MREEWKQFNKIEAKQDETTTKYEIYIIVLQPKG